MVPRTEEYLWLGGTQLVFYLVENLHQLDGVKQTSAFFSISLLANGLRCPERLGPVALCLFSPLLAFHPDV